MFTFDQVPSTTSLLMECGYRSKVCNNLRATKLDGTLHKLCEFHRRKANLNQQKLHKRQREERALLEQTQSPKARPAKTTRRSYQPTIEPILRDTTAQFPYCFSTEDYHLQSHRLVDDQAFPKLTWEDMDILELLLHDMQPHALPSLERFLSDTSDKEDTNSITA